MRNTIKTTPLDAARKWVGEFNAYPRDMIEKLWQSDPDEWSEITLPGVGSRVYVYEPPAGSPNEGEVIKFLPSHNSYAIRLDDSSDIFASSDDFELVFDDILPMWGTMWAFGNAIDDDWLRGEFGTDGLRLMSECGFRVYESDRWGYFFGIDGAGYSFYEQHWVPLYRARGLCWHDVENGEDGKEEDGNV